MIDLGENTFSNEKYIYIDTYRYIQYLLGIVFGKLIDVIWPSVKQK